MPKFVRNIPRDVTAPGQALVRKRFLHGLDVLRGRLQRRVWDAPLDVLGRPRVEHNITRTWGWFEERSMKRGPKPLPKYLTPEEIDRLFRVITSIRDRALFRVAYHRGLASFRTGTAPVLGLSAERGTALCPAPQRIPLGRVSPHASRAAGLARLVARKGNRVGPAVRLAQPSSDFPVALGPTDEALLRTGRHPAGKGAYACAEAFLRHALSAGSQTLWQSKITWDTQISKTQ